MVIFSDYYHRQIETASNMKEIGILTMEEMGTRPFFSVHYEGKRLKRTKDKHCKETEEDCFALVNKYFEVKWNNARQTKDSWKDNHYDAHICTEDEIP